MKKTWVMVGLLFASAVSFADFVQIERVATPEKIFRAVNESKRLGREEGDFGQIDLVEKYIVHQATEERLFYVLRGIIEANQVVTRDSDLLSDILKSKKDSLTHEQMGPYTLLEWCAIQSKFEEDWEENSKWKGLRPERLNSQCANYLLNKKLVTDANPDNWQVTSLMDSGDHEFDVQSNIIKTALLAELGEGAREVKLNLDPYPSVDGQILILLSKDLKKAFVVRSDLGA